MPVLRGKGGGRRGGELLVLPEPSMDGAFQVSLEASHPLMWAEALQPTLALQMLGRAI